MVALQERLEIGMSRLLTKDTNEKQLLTTFSTRLCYGQCNSFYIPNDDVSDRASVFATCSTCKFHYRIGGKLVFPKKFVKIPLVQRFLKEKIRLQALL